MSVSRPAAAFLINALARGIPFSFSQLYLAAFTTNPPVSGDPSFAEVSGPGYARVAVTFAAPVNGNAAGGQVTFPVATGSWGAITFLGLCDTSAGGTVMVEGSVTSTPITTNQILRINNLNLSFV